MGWNYQFHGMEVSVSWDGYISLVGRVCTETFANY